VICQRKYATITPVFKDHEAEMIQRYMVPDGVPLKHTYSTRVEYHLNGVPSILLADLNVYLGTYMDFIVRKKSYLLLFTKVLLIVCLFLLSGIGKSYVSM
jgi:hypothetical protein